MAKFWAWLKKIPAWTWVITIAVGLLVTAVLGWRRAEARLAAALEKARSAEAALEIESEAAEEHAEVAAELDDDVARIDAETEARLEEIETRAEAVDDAERKQDGSLAEMANKHFGNDV